MCRINRLNFTITLLNWELKKVICNQMASHCVTVNGVTVSGYLCTELRSLALASYERTDKAHPATIEGSDTPREVVEWKGVVVFGGNLGCRAHSEDVNAVRGSRRRCLHMEHG